MKKEKEYADHVDPTDFQNTLLSYGPVEIPEEEKQEDNEHGDNCHI